MAVGFTGRMARSSARRPWVTIGVWAAGLAAAIYASGFLGDALTQDERITIPTDAAAVAELEAQYRSGPDATASETIIVRADRDHFGDADFMAVLADVTAAASAVDGVTRVVTPRLDAPYPVSDDGRTALVIAERDSADGVDLNDLGTRLNAAVAAIDAPGYTVIAFGEATAGATMDGLAEETLVKGESIGIGIALVILAIVFGALVAAGIPVILGLVSIAVAVGLSAVVGQVFELSFFIVNMISMMGLALSIDYALIVVQRFREERSRGLAKIDAITVAGSTATRAVFFSGLTVIVSLTGLMLVPSTIMRSLSAGAVLVAITSVAAALTLLPAVLSLLGDRVNKGRIPTAHPGREPRAWAAVARAVLRKPALAASLGTTALVLLALPIFSMRLAFPGLETLPEDNTVRMGQDILVADFGYGRETTTIAIEGAANNPAAVASLVDGINADPAFADTSVDDRGDVVFVDTHLVFDTSDARADAAVRHLHDDVLPAAFDGTGATATLGGSPWGEMEFTQVVTDAVPAVLGLVLGASFILLLVGFRSIVVPITGILLNLLSAGAAYGVLVAVFQWGWGADLLGLPQSDSIAPWLPLFLFAVLFGLSMDYHVFLLSRIKERHDAGEGTSAAIIHGLSRTGALITGAALIMVAVFSGFATGDLAEFAQMGFGLAAAVILDATLVRIVLVPAVMALLGRANWYLPTWLNWLPAMRIDGDAEQGARPGADEQELEPALV